MLSMEILKYTLISQLTDFQVFSHIFYLYNFQTLTIALFLFQQSVTF